MVLKIRFILIMLGSLLLTACGSDAIEEVKSVVNYQIDKSLTLGKAFETRSDCQDGVWAENQGKRDRTIITYTCMLPEQGLKFINAKLLERLKSKVDTENKEIERQIAERLSHLKSLNLELQSTEKVNSYINEVANDLRQVFLKQDLGSHGLNEKEFLLYAFHLVHESKNVRYSNVESHCNYVDSYYLHYVPSSDFERDYGDVIGLCKKHVLPIILAFDEKQLKEQRVLDYDLTASMQDLSRYDESESNEEILGEVNKKFKKHIDGLKKALSSIPPDQSRYDNALAEVQKVYEEAISKVNIGSMQIQQGWIVSETGGVENLNGELTVNSASGTTATRTISGEALMNLAYYDFTSESVSKLYAEAGVGMMYETAQEYYSKLDQITHDLRSL